MLDYEKLEFCFREDAKKLETRPLPPEMDAAAVGYWTHYPLYLSVLDAGLVDRERPLPAYWGARDALKHAHSCASQALVGLAERQGLDGGPLWTASRICVLAFPPGERAVGCGVWPEDYAERIGKLPPDERASVRQGFETLLRLSERLDARGAADTPASKAPKGRGCKKKAITMQRASFAKPQIENDGKSWPDIHKAYLGKYPKDTDATPSKIRQAYNREYPVK